jgi:hypothetical protein
MLDCPIRDRRGNCRTFSEYIYATLLRNGIQHRYDVEAALQYVIEKMLMDRSETTGEPRDNLFRGFKERPDYVGGNPLVGRFLAFLDGAVRNIRKNRIPRFLDTRQDGMVRIGQGRARRGEKTDDIRPDELPGRPDADADLGEMIEDITGLLRRKERTHPIPLVALFQAMIGGMTVNEQRRRFGDSATRTGRQIIVQTVEEYARSSGHAYLLHLIQHLSEPGDRVSQERPVVQRPALSDEERDYRSIASVVAKFERPVGTADLGRFRRRWLEYPPRTKDSPHRNRLEEVLARMVADGVLKATKGMAGGQRYSPGPQFSRYSTQEQPL